MGKLKTIILEDDGTEIKKLKSYLNKIGFDCICLTTDTEAERQFLKQQSLFLLVDLNENGSKEKNNLNDYLKKLNDISSFMLIPNSNLENFFQHKEQIIQPSKGTKNAIAQQKPVEGSAIFVKIGKVFKQILLEDIDYIFYEARHANLKIGKKNIPVKISMREFAQRLPSERFIQIHQAHIINLAKMTQINLSSNQVEIQGKWLPIGTKFFKKFKETISIFY